MATQLDLDLTARTWGGARKGAGRPKSKTNHDSPHQTRPVHVGRFPVHVVLRTVRDVERLRSDKIHSAIGRALAKVGERLDFRIVHISIQHNHLHLLVEADSNAALESGMRAFAISAARRINRVLGRTGKVFAFRYHTTTLRTPTQVRNALCYVLNNWRRHDEDERTLDNRTAILDRYSSAIRFTGWANWTLAAWPRDYNALPVSTARTWLLARGWQLAKKPIRTDEVPGKLQ